MRFHIGGVSDLTIPDASASTPGLITPAQLTQLAGLWGQVETASVDVGKNFPVNTATLLSFVPNVSGATKGSFLAEILLFKMGGSGGGVGTVVRRPAVFTLSAGVFTLAQQGADTYSVGDEAAGTFALSTNGTNIIVTVTGDAGENLTFACSLGGRFFPRTF